jgi:hypothetical protein
LPTTLNALFCENESNVIKNNDKVKKYFIVLFWLSSVLLTSIFNNIP